MFLKKSEAFRRRVNWMRNRSGAVPHFKIDVNIDGIQLFENTIGGSAVPILARIHSVGKFKIPVRKSLPLLVGMYHGPSKLH